MHETVSIRSILGKRARALLDGISRFDRSGHLVDHRSPHRGRAV